jgi:hypothetical protein
VRPSPSYRPFPLENVSGTPERQKDTIFLTVGTEEQDFGLIVQIYEALFDTRALSGDQKIQNALIHKCWSASCQEPRFRPYVNVFFKGQPGVSAQTIQSKVSARVPEGFGVGSRRQYAAFCAAFGDIFILERLSRSKAIVFVKPDAQIAQDMRIWTDTKSLALTACAD